MMFLGIGSSLGNAEVIFSSAAVFLLQNGVKIRQKSKILKNPPLGNVAQNEFSNAVWEVSLSDDFAENEGAAAKKLLQICKACEAEHGRDFKSKKWDDRPLDLDILMFHNLVLDQKSLKIPHPEIKNRDFVLAPWRELVPADFEIPSCGNLHNLLESVIRR